MNSQMKSYKGRDPEGPKCGSICICGVGMHHPPSTWMCSPTQKLYKPQILGIFMEASPCRCDQLLINSISSPPPLPGG